MSMIQEKRPLEEDKISDACKGIKSQDLSCRIAIPPSRFSQCPLKSEISI